MPDQYIYKLRDGNHLIAAEFSITTAATSTVSVTFESANGQGKNSEYNLGLTELLRRISEVAQYLDDCIVVSNTVVNTLGLSEDARRVRPHPPFIYPVNLWQVEDFELLRIALTAPQKDIGSSSKSGGNSQKRILLRFSTTEPFYDNASLAKALNAEQSYAKEKKRKDIASGVTADDINFALGEWKEIKEEAFHNKYGTYPANRYVIADPEGNEYDAKAILFAARIHAGLGGKNSDFEGNHETVRKPLQDLGFVVDDITDDSEVEASDSKVNLERAIEQAKAFAGSTDAKVQRTVRREQKLLRRALGLHKGTASCFFCGREYPTQLLVAAHIKRRSDCEHAERVDIPAVAVPACTLGCDSLFEFGYITVSEDARIIAANSTDENGVKQYVEPILGRHLPGVNGNNAKYFAWHRERWSR